MVDKPWKMNNNTIRQACNASSEDGFSSIPHTAFLSLKQFLTIDLRKCSYKADRLDISESGYNHALHSQESVDFGFITISFVRNHPHLSGKSSMFIYLISYTKFVITDPRTKLFTVYIIYYLRIIYLYSGFRQCHRGLYSTYSSQFLFEKLYREYYLLEDLVEDVELLVIMAISIINTYVIIILSQLKSLESFCYGKVEIFVTNRFVSGSAYKCFHEKCRFSSHLSLYMQTKEV